MGSCFRSCLQLILPAFPCEAGAFSAELYQPTVFHLGDVCSAAVGAAEADVAGPLAESIDLLQHFTGG